MYLNRFYEAFWSYPKATLPLFSIFTFFNVAHVTLTHAHLTKISLYPYIHQLLTSPLVISIDLSPPKSSLQQKRARLCPAQLCGLSHLLAQTL